MDAKDRLQPQRWRRMVMWLKERAMWAAKGVLLWLLQRPYLRWLPLPYPATASLGEVDVPGYHPGAVQSLARKTFEGSPKEEALQSRWQV